MKAMHELQHAVRHWHVRKYGMPALSKVGNKLAEEAGEVCRAICRIEEISEGTRGWEGFADKNAALEHWRTELAREIGDASIVLLRLVDRIGMPFDGVIETRFEEVSARPSPVPQEDKESEVTQ